MNVRTTFAGILALGMVSTAVSFGAQSQTTSQADKAAAPPPAAGTPGPATPVKGKNSKAPYTGPNTVVVLPATPMLDAEGKQRVDPDGKPMFNPPAQQIRDKKGHPVFDENGKPVFATATDPGYDEKGKKIAAKKVKPPKAEPVSIVGGTLTVDGWTGKARLNYDIADLRFMYIYVPGIGTSIVSQNSFPGAKEQPGAFNGKSLKVTVDGHPIEVASDKLLLGKKPQSAWVAVDRGFLLPAKFPVFGYGSVTKAPYAWPGSKEGPVANGAIQAPPLPVDVRPTMQLTPCPAGMMRPAALPGQTAGVQPCVPISTAAAPTASPSPATPAAK